MNDIAHQQAIQEAAKARFRGRKRLKGRVRVLYPEHLEREYRRAVNAYLGLLGGALKKELPRLQRILLEQENNNARYDDAQDWAQSVAGVFSTIREQLDEMAEACGLLTRLGKISEQARRFTTRQWKRTVHATLGIDLFADYYSGEFYGDIFPVWLQRNVDLIKRIPHDALGEMHSIVTESFRANKPTRRILEEIQREYRTTKSHASLLARDQMGKLHGQITRQQQMDAGVPGYYWSTSRDSRVRDGHADLDGRYFSWSDPPVVDHRTGRRAHPGDDYQCRCVALPAFSLDTLALPGQAEPKNT